MIQDRRSRKVIVVPDYMINDLHATFLQSFVQDGYGLVQLPDLSVLTARAATFYIRNLVDQLEEYSRNQHEIAVVHLKASSNPWLSKMEREVRRRGIRWTLIFEL
jgi:uroporphyrinogen-III decarboxylase